MMSESDRLTVSIAEAADMLGIGRATAYEWARQGLLPSLSMGRRVLVPYKALHRMIDAAEEEFTWPVGS